MSRLSLAPRVRYLIGRARRIDVGSVVERAKEASEQHHKAVPSIVVDMLWSAARHNVGFQDYIDYDFAMLTRAERETYMTHPVSNQLSQRYDHPDFRWIFQDKVEFDKQFSVRSIVSSTHLFQTRVVSIGSGQSDGT